MLFDSHDHLPLPFDRWHRSGLHRGETSVCTSPNLGGTARFRRPLCPLLTSATRSSPLTVRSVQYWTRGRSPGVNTHLCAHERRVYMFGLGWIEDFTLCCRLVPPNPPNSVLVHRPMRSRYPASAGRLPSRAPSPVPGCHTAIPFASIRLGLGLDELLNNW